MKIAFVLFDGMTTLDFSGFFDAMTQLNRVPGTGGVSWRFCALTERIVDDRGLAMQANAVAGDLTDFDLVFVPGGMATRQLRHDETFLAWLRTAEGVPWKASVCTGALLMGAAGWLNGKRATTNKSAYELLAPYCSEVVRERYVRDDRVFTGGGVSASIDLGLFVAESLYGTAAAKEVGRLMDYPYYQFQSA
ncbi:DJ-1/PfpI family protein [Paenibacillus methanolicus]|uniref:Cyclohexyl-isocyanide hydratase n=1 Tax=Paenibacillus methanolicus TaxID=582686 RepID=A0A5S5BZV7_9BACL|nr:DJ-1/PfpI family protein [Paenibacillus methanolicus]TYP72479.1 cyclohexyl-isocyanide hydratase [Paenibacillus methanolicus]